MRCYSNIMRTRNVSECLYSLYAWCCRSLPKSELAAVASFLRSIYTCDVDSLPVESLAHRYWNQFRSQHDNSADYVRCLQRCNVTLAPCLNHTARHCGRRFGERSPERLVDCNRLLWSDKYRANYPDVDTRRQFQLYRQCRADLRSKVSAQRRFSSAVEPTASFRLHYLRQGGYVIVALLARLQT